MSAGTPTRLCKPMCAILYSLNTSSGDPCPDMFLTPAVLRCAAWTIAREPRARREASMGSVLVRGAADHFLSSDAGGPSNSHFSPSFNE